MFPCFYQIEPNYYFLILLPFSFENFRISYFVSSYLVIWKIKGRFNNFLARYNFSWGVGVEAGQIHGPLKSSPHGLTGATMPKKKR